MDTASVSQLCQEVPPPPPVTGLLLNLLAASHRPRHSHLGINILLLKMVNILSAISRDEITAKQQADVTSVT